MQGITIREYIAKGAAKICVDGVIDQSILDELLFALPYAEIKRIWRESGRAIIFLKNGKMYELQLIKQ